MLQQETSFVDSVASISLCAVQDASLRTELEEKNSFPLVHRKHVGMGFVTRDKKLGQI